MMDFNIDYVLGHLPVKRPLTSRSMQIHIENLVNLLDRILNYNDRIMVNKAFVRLEVASKPKAQKFAIVQKYAQQKLQSAFYSLLHSSLNQQTSVSTHGRLRYPFVVFFKVFSTKAQRHKEEVFTTLRKNKVKSRERQDLLIRMATVLKQYLRRNVTAKLYRGLTSFQRKTEEYQTHIGSFQYLFETIRVKKLFEAFTSMSIKTITKNLGQLEREKAHKRDQARASLIKRSQLINQLKRKVTNAVGQVNEAQINNNRRRVNGSRENGAKLIKLNEEMRIMEIQTEDIEHRVASMKKQIDRKTNYLLSRQNSTTTFERINSLYHRITSLASEIPEDQLFRNLELDIPAQISSRQQGLYFNVMENIKLSHLMNLYQKIGENKKVQSYTNANSQNQHLKMLIGSLINLEYLCENVGELTGVAKKVRGMAEEFLESRRTIRQGTE